MTTLRGPRRRAIAAVCAGALYVAVLTTTHKPPAPAPPTACANFQDGTTTPCTSPIDAFPQTTDNQPHPQFNPQQMKETPI